MFWIIIFAVVMFFPLRGLYKDFKPKGFKECGQFFGVCLLATVLIGSFYALLMVIPSSFDPGVSYRDAARETRIYYLQGNSEFSGSFFLGSGTISSSEYYYFYQDHGNSGAKVREEVPTRDTPIFEDNSREPVVRTHMRVIDDVNTFWAMPQYLLLDREDYIGWTKGRRGKILGYELTVPEGTIIQEFRLE